MPALGTINTAAPGATAIPMKWPVSMGTRVYLQIVNTPDTVVVILQDNIYIPRFRKMQSD